MRASKQGGKASVDVSSPESNAIYNPLAVGATRVTWVIRVVPSLPFRWSLFVCPLLHFQLEALTVQKGRDHDQ